MKKILETERLILRPFRESDAHDMFYGWTNDPEVTKYLTWNTHQTIEETQYVLDMWVKEYEDPKRINFAIELKDGNRLIGGTDVVGYEEGSPVIGYNLSRRYWNKGYMTEACKCVLEYLFSIGYSRVIIEADVDNTGSNKVIQKCGGVLYDTCEKYVPMKDKTVLVNKYSVEPALPFQSSGA